jgi:preprotein translocase subunit SecD
MLQIPMWKRVLIWSTCALALLFAVPNLFYDRVEQHNDAVAMIEAGQGNWLHWKMRAPAGLPSCLLSL